MTGTALGRPSGHSFGCACSSLLQISCVLPVDGRLEPARSQAGRAHRQVTSSCHGCFLWLACCDSSCNLLCLTVPSPFLSATAYRWRALRIQPLQASQLSQVPTPQGLTGICSLRRCSTEGFISKSCCLHCDLAPSASHDDSSCCCASARISSLSGCQLYASVLQH